MIHAVLVGAGRGERFGFPKQLARIDGKTVVEIVVERFSNHERIDDIVLVASEEILDRVKLLIPDVRIVLGGKTRTESVRRGLEAISGGDDDVVLIHDVARPFVSERIIDANIDAVEKNGAVCTAIDPVDTMALVEDGEVKEVLNRSRLKRLQTPQTFRLGLIKKAHELAKKEGKSFTDDCSLILHYDLARPVTIEGDILNMKITYPVDLEVLRAMTRVLGYR